MRLWNCCLCALALLSAAASEQAEAYEVFATSFFSPEAGDPDPGLTGVLKIDTLNGAATTFIPESTGGLIQPTDVVVDEATNTLYVSTQNGRIWHYDATTGAPRSSFVSGEPAGVFAVLPTAGFGDGVNTMLLRRNGTLLTGTAFGSLVPFDKSTGAQLADLASELSFPSGLAEPLQGSTVFVATGDPFGGPGELTAIYPNNDPETLVAFDSSDGIRGAANPVIVSAPGDYSRDGKTNRFDYDAWSDAYGDSGTPADGNGDGIVDAIDYTVYRDTDGEESSLLIADLNGNRLASYDGAGTNSTTTLAIIPPDIPDPLPATANPLAPSNSPSEILLSPRSTLLVSTLGLTRRPDNRGALLEFDRDGTFLGTLASDLPPLSGIAFVPASSTAVPEPGALLLVVFATGSLALRSRG